MNSPRKTRPLLACVGLTVLATATGPPALQAAVTLDTSDAFVVAGVPSGDLSITGDLSVLRGIDFGIATAHPALAAVQFNYFGGTANAVKFDLTDALGTVQWRDNLAATVRAKMTLDGANLLTLFKSDGTTAGILLNPNTGQIHLSESGGGIYAGGTPVFTLGATGNLIFGTRPLSLAAAMGATASATGALTVAGGISVALDSYVNGVRMGRGSGNAATNTAFGVSALGVNSMGYANAAFGYKALCVNKMGYSNTAAGYMSLCSNMGGYYNTAAGSEALYSNSTGSSNTASGYYALRANTTGLSNTAAGCYSLSANTTGMANTGAGHFALGRNSTGAFNTANGCYTLYSNTLGNCNTGAGYYSLYSNITGGSNTGAGYLSLYYNTTGASNVAIGAGAGMYQANGGNGLTATNRSIYIGAECRGFSNLDQNSIVLGASAVGEGANTTVIGNSSTLRTHLYGTVNASGFSINEVPVITSCYGPESVLSNGALLALGSGAGATRQGAVAIGANAAALGIHSYALGGATAADAYATALGTCNLSAEGLLPVVSADEWLEESALFELGNGNPATTETVQRSNAITTLKNGQTTLTNKAWKANAEAPLADPDASTDSGGEALVVEGHTRLRGQVIIEQAQGDISMGIYGP